MSDLRRQFGPGDHWPPEVTPRLYRVRAPVLMARMETPFRTVSAGGVLMYGEPGDYLVGSRNGPGGFEVVEASRHAALYAPVSDREAEERRIGPADRRAKQASDRRRHGASARRILEPETPP